MTNNATNSSELKDKLQYYRLRAGYTQKELAVQLYVAPSTLSKWENGASPWSRAALTRYCEILGVNKEEKRELFVLAGLDTFSSEASDQVSTQAEAKDSAIVRSETTLSTTEMDLPPITGEIVASSKEGRGRWTKWGSAGIGLASIVLIALALSTRMFSAPPPCQIVLDGGWLPVSALLERNQDGSVTITENNPDAAYGKIESEIIEMEIDSCPILYIAVGSMEPDSSYTIQILDKGTEYAVDVLKDITFPGEHTVNLAEEMAWQGTQEFTINVWISGEDKSARFDRINIEVE